MKPLRRAILFGAAAAILAAASACSVERTAHANRAEDSRGVVLSDVDGDQVEALLASPEQARLFVEGQEQGEGMGALEASRQGDGVVLGFRFPLVASATYVLHHPAFDAPLRIAGEPRVASPPSVVGVRPNASELPSNLLRLYVEFDEPMSSKFLMSDAVEVVDLSDGSTVDAALLDMEQPLFDREGTRLTVILNPGRTKRGVGSNAQGGPPLLPGREYALRVKSGLRDAQGDPLGEDFMHAFRTVSPNRTAIDVSSWEVLGAKAGTRAPMRIAFDRWMDPHQTERRIVLYNALGGRVPLRAEGTGRELTLTPKEAWAEGCHTLVVSRELEDVSGNRVVRAFDEKGKGARAAVRRAVSVGGASCEVTAPR